jgi:hypothetical protein
MVNNVHSPQPNHDSMRGSSCNSTSRDYFILSVSIFVCGDKSEGSEFHLLSDHYQEFFGSLHFLMHLSKMDLL